MKTQKRLVKDFDLFMNNGSVADHKGDYRYYHWYKESEGLVRGNAWGLFPCPVWVLAETIWDNFCSDLRWYLSTGLNGVFQYELGWRVSKSPQNLVV